MVHDVVAVLAVAVGKAVRGQRMNCLSCQRATKDNSCITLGASNPKRDTPGRLVAVDSPAKSLTFEGLVENPT